MMFQMGNKLSWDLGRLSFHSRIVGAPFEWTMRFFVGPSTIQVTCNRKKVEPEIEIRPGLLKTSEFLGHRSFLTKTIGFKIYSDFLNCMNTWFFRFNIFESFESYMFVYDIVNKEGRRFLTHRTISNWENRYSGSINNEMKVEASVCSRNVPFKHSILPILDDNLCNRRKPFPY
jgi:hypothetical protein